MNLEFQELLDYFRCKGTSSKIEEVTFDASSSHTSIVKKADKKLEYIDLPIEYLRLNKEKIYWSTVSDNILLNDQIID